MMIDPLDTYHRLMDARPKLLHKTPPSMCRWIGSIKQQYGTVAVELRDLQAEYEAVREKAEKWDVVRPAMANTMLEQKDKLEAIKKIAFDEEYEDDPYVGEARALEEIKKILEGKE